MTTTLDKLDTINDSLNDIKTAVIAKGQTPTGDITTYATAISNIVQSSPVISSLSITPTTSQQTITAPSGTDGYSPITVSAVTSSIDSNISAENIKKDVTILGVVGSYEGSGGGSSSYQLHRVKDDSNNEIGTAFMEFEDANGNKYDVVCLDAQYRNSSTKWCSSTVVVTDMPVYSDLSTSNLWEAKETATQNTQLILDFCAAESANSTSCTYCRNQSFTIGGTIYYGQLPNMTEVIEIAKNYSSIETMDTSSNSYTSTNFSSSRNIWSSNQLMGQYAWYLDTFGRVNYNNKSSGNFFACPVLEIPVS